MKKIYLAAFAGLCCVATIVHAAEAITYSYDAKGRLVKVVRTGTVNNDVITNYTHDKSDNRKTVVVTGSVGGPPP